MELRHVESKLETRNIWLIFKMNGAMFLLPLFLLSWACLFWNDSVDDRMIWLASISVLVVSSPKVRVRPWNPPHIFQKKEIQLIHPQNHLKSQLFHTKMSQQIRPKDLPRLPSGCLVLFGHHLLQDRPLRHGDEGPGNARTGPAAPEGSGDHALWAGCRRRNIPLGSRGGLEPHAPWRNGQHDHQTFRL